MFFYLKKIYLRSRQEARNLTNPIFAPIRLKQLKKLGIDDNFTIISNNCWAGAVYQHYGLQYKTPTIGLFFFAKDYIKFCYDLKKYLTHELEFIPLEKSRYYTALLKFGGRCVHCPIAKCEDIEIIFMHYSTPKEAEQKWFRRAERINWDNIIYKFSEMNECSEDDLFAFEALPAQKKIVFTHKEYGLEHSVVFTEFEKIGYIPNDTDIFRKYLDLQKLLDGK